MSGKGKVLTTELVFNKTKSDNLQSIKNLNLWGNQLEDLQLIEKMPNLEVISLSVNRIASLKDFAHCNKLQELYLRKNCIADLREIKHLLKLPTLKVLWLHDNPCANVDHYREIVIHHLPNLVKLDNNLVSQEEKVHAQKQQFELSGLEDEKSNEGRQVKEGRESRDGREGREARNRPYSEMQINRPDTRQQLREQREQQREQRQIREIRQQQREVRQGRDSRQVKEVREVREVKEIKQARGSITEWESSNQSGNRSRNVLIAILSLMKELDTGSLQIVRKESDRLLRL